MDQQTINQPFAIDSLVLYRKNPARVSGFTGPKIAIELKDGKTVMVRPTDITQLHPGAVGNIATLSELPIPPDIEEVCELLGNEQSTLEEVTELLYNGWTPSAAWSAYQILCDGLYFTGTPSCMLPRPAAERDKEIASRNQVDDDKRAWSAFIEALRSGVVAEENRYRLASLTEFALGKTSGSTIVKALNIAATEVAAHKLLLKLGVWDHLVNPYPSRAGIDLAVTYEPVANSADNDERIDLTHLAAYAIDDEGNSDPDDAISIDGDTIWIHIADVAAVIKPDSAADAHACSFGATHYLPEKITPMLAPELTEQLGLGLQPISPALSFCLTIAPDGSITSTTIHQTRIAVTRQSYADADNHLSDPFLAQLDAITRRYQQRRKANHAVFLSFPEIRIRIENGVVTITPIPETRSREMVAEAMMMASEAAALFAQKEAIPFPFTVQPAPEAYEEPTTLAAMFAYRKKLKPSRIQSSPEPHAGLGITAYSRVTSPLRRYIDLVAHQQLRSYLHKEQLMDEQMITSKIGAYNAVIGAVTKLERIVNQHWTLVYLLQHPHWTGKGIVLEQRERYYLVLIPELAFETRITSSKTLPLDSTLTLALTSVDLAELSVFFTITN